MTPHDISKITATCDNDTPVYSSRIIRVYLDYLRVHYPHIDPDSIIGPAGIKPAEVDDPGFWYSQNQAECMHALMAEKTEDARVSRAAGQFIATSKALGKIRQFTLALATPAFIYRQAEKLYPMMSRGATLKVEILGPHKIKAVASPVPGIDEAPFQCENRLGILEGIASLFSKRSANVKHTKCRHQGDGRCEYIITWKPTKGFILKSVKCYMVTGGGILGAGLFFILPGQAWLFTVAAIAGVCIGTAFLSDHFEKRELARALEDHLKLMEDPHEDSELRYNNSLLVQELGRETARIFDLSTYLEKVMAVLRKHLGFDRGAILLKAGANQSVSLAASYGYSHAEKKLLDIAGVRLAAPQAERFFITLMQKGKSLLVNNLSDLEKKIHPRSYAFGTLLKIHAFISVPIIYENQPRGILLLDNTSAKRKYYQSDVNFLEGLAGQIATSIINAESFARLQDSEEKFRMVFQTSPDAFAINRYDDGVYVDINEGFTALTGYSRADLLGKTPADLDIWASRNDRRKVAVEIGKKGSIGNYETRFRAKNSRLISGQISAKIVMLGQEKHVLSITRDVTELKRMENERKKLGSRLRHSAKMESIGTLAGGIAHDFNNLMMGIQGNIELMALDTEPTSDNFIRLKNIEQHIESGAKLTRQLLGFAQAGKYDVRTTNLNDLVRRTSRMFARTRKELSVRLEPAENIWAVEADQSQIEQVILNILVNAWQAMPGGGEILIKISNTVMDNDQARLKGTHLGSYVLITVTDTGVGMDAATQEKIFDPFFTTRKMGRGTGLGLASAYGIIKNHSGTIEVNSQKGTGTSFNIYIPASGKKTARPAERARPIEKGTGNVLLVDDEEMIVDVGKQLLEHLGYSVMTADSGKGALDLVIGHHKEINLVILDLVMPEMGGGETFDAIKTVAPQIKVLLSSGYALEGEAAEILGRGCNGFIQKPFSLNDLSEKIREVLDPADNYKN